MSLNADPLSRISKSFSSSSADQIVEALRAPVRTIPTPTAVFSTTVQRWTDTRQIMAVCHSTTTASRLGTRIRASRIEDLGS